MNIPKEIILVGLLSAILLGCSSVKTTVSQPEEDRAENQFNYYNSGNKLSYHLTHDEKYLYIRLRTEDRMSLMKILRTGLTIYFDITGKKNKDTYLEYPMAGEVQIPVSNMLRNGSKYDRNLTNLIREISTEAVFVKDDKLERLDISGKHEIQALLYSDTRNSIIYSLAMPIDRLVASAEELNNVSIGVVSGKFQMPNFGGAAGGRGGRMAGGRPGTGRRTPAASSNMQSMTQPIVLWMRIDIPES